MPHSHQRGARPAPRPVSSPAPSPSPAPPEPAPGDLIPLAEACQMIPSRKPGKKIAISTLFRWVMKGKLRGWRIGGGIFVSTADVQRLARPIPVELDPQLRERLEWEAMERWTDEVLYGKRGR